MKDWHGTSYYFLAEDIDREKGTLTTAYPCRVSSPLILEAVVNCRLNKKHKISKTLGTINFEVDPNNRDGNENIVMSSPVSEVVMGKDFIALKPSKEGQLRWREVIQTLFEEEIR